MKSAKIALELLLANNAKEANVLVEEIEEINNRRKKLTKVLYNEALGLYDESQNAIIIHSPRMHEGVLGIVASRLANDYGKVAVVLKEEEYTFKGSIRSYHGVDVIKVLEKLSSILERFGGHKNACGLEFKKEHLQTFKQQFEALIPDAEVDEVYEAEGIVDIETLDLKQISDLERYDLKDALFVFEGSKILAKYLIKGEHTKLILSGNTDALFFNNKLLYQQVKKNGNINLLGRLDINTFQNQTKKVILIEDYQIL
jgi:single-stranded-DNA-specific exonuclease